MTRRLLLALLVSVLAAGALVGTTPAASGIVGGTQVQDGELPFMVSIQSAGSRGSEGQICGGSVVARRWVLTAAHCTVFEPRQVQLVVGRTDLTDEGGQVLRVDRMRVHPDYAETGSSDVALWHTTRRIKAPAIALVGSGEDGFEAAGTTLTVAGWGAEAYQAPGGPDRMKQLDVQVTSDLECQTNTLLGFAPDTEFCASELLGDSCQGDSGGPIFGLRTDGTPVQVGAVSYGLGCATPLFPGVYAELSAPGVAGWIRRTVPGLRG